MTEDRGMGATFITGRVSGPRAEAVEVRFLVDTGAMYSLLPHDVWRMIGLTPKRAERFALADGTTIRRSVSECDVALPQGSTHTPVILGEPGDVALLGVVTLEELGLVMDPFARTLRPMELRL